MSKWMKKDDRVVVIAGNHKGKTGTVISRTEERVVIQGVNIRKKHIKSKDRNHPSRVLEIEMPIHISNAAICNSDGKPVKMKSRVTPEGGKELYYIDADKEVVYRQLRKNQK